MIWEPIHIWNTQFTREMNRFKILLVKSWCTKTSISDTKWNLHIRKLISRMKFTYRVWNCENLILWYCMWNVCKGTIEQELDDTYVCSGLIRLQIYGSQIQFLWNFLALFSWIIILSSYVSKRFTKDDSIINFKTKSVWRYSLMPRSVKHYCITLLLLPYLCNF